MKKGIDVLVIDDDATTNFVLGKLFEMSNTDFNPLFITRAEEALEHLHLNKNKFPSLIILDINMPGMDGWDFLDEYEDRNYHIDYKETIIIMISSSIRDLDQKKALSYQSVVEFVTKPLKLDGIKRIREQYFEGKMI